MSGVITIESLAEGQGVNLFGDSWKPIQAWLNNLASMDASANHKVWAYIAAASFVTAKANQKVYVQRLGHQHLNLGIIYIGQVTTVVNNLVSLVRDSAYASGVALAPYDTDGHRQGLIQALSGFKPMQRKQKTTALGPATKANKAALNPVQKRLQEILMGSDSSIDGKADSLGVFAETDTSEVEEIDASGVTFLNRPSGIIIPNIRMFLKDSQGELSTLLTNCLLGETIDIQQQQHRYLIPNPTLSLLSTGKPEDLLGRGGYVNHTLLANLIPVYCPHGDGSSFRVPSGEGRRNAVESIRELAEGMSFRQELRFSDTANMAFERVAEIQLQTIDLNLAGLADRRVHMLVKIAGILASACGRSQVNGNDVELANFLLLTNETSVERSYSGLLAERSDARSFIRIFDFLEAHGSATVEELCGYLRHTTPLREQELIELIHRFFATGKVSENKHGQLHLATDAADARLLAASNHLRKRIAVAKDSA